MRGWETAQRSFLIESGKTLPQKIGSSNILDLRGFELLWDQTLQICEAVVILFKERDWNKKRVGEEGTYICFWSLRGRRDKVEERGNRDPKGWFVCIQSNFTNPLLRVLF